MSASVHARRRSRERFGVSLHRKDAACIIAEIRSGRATFLRYGDHRREIWLVRFGDGFARVVFCRRDAEIITVMIQKRRTVEADRKKHAAAMRLRERVR